MNAVENIGEAARAPGMSGSTFDGVTALFEKAVKDGVFPGAVCVVAHRGVPLFKRAFGSMMYKSAKLAEPTPVTLDTVFDVAGLTTAFVTTTVMMKIIEAGKAKLSERVSRYVQGFGVHGKSAITIGHLLSHSSGLPHWMPFFEDLIEAQAGSRRGIVTSRGAREYVANAIARLSPKTEPGGKQIYSDVGFMLLGFMVETLTGLSLDRAASRHVFQPLGLKSTSYIDLSMIKRRGIHPVTDVIAPTEECSWRKRLLCGEVHDDNAWVMGGIAGHAGVFTTAADLHTYASEIVKAYEGRSQFVKAETVRLFWAGPSGEPEQWRYGWDSPSKENNMLETGLSRNAVGLNGFTGCSLWIEPEAGLHVILMSNRIHPSESNRKILAFRPEAHRQILEAISR